jgi:hypothetical protein
MSTQKLSVKFLCLLSFSFLSLFAVFLSSLSPKREIHQREGSQNRPPTISNMEKLTVLVIGLGEDFKTTLEIIEADSKMDNETACKPYST